MENMTAVQFWRYGGPDVLKVVTVQRPEPGPDEVLVKVEASTVNWHDVVVRSGALKIVTGRRFPLGLGLDFAGTVVATGGGVGDLPAGMPVWGMASPRSGNLTGSAAQYVAVPAVRVAPIPAGMSWTDAASLVTSGTDVVRALRDVAHVQPGQRVLIRGGAGGVGMIAVQLAKALGAQVTALASHRDLEFVTQLGAHEALDYRAVTPQQLGPFDAIFDTAGSGLLAYRRRLKNTGRMITIDFGSAAAMTSIAVSYLFGAKRIRTFSGYPDRQLLNDLADYVKAGAIWPVVAAAYPMENIAEAHQALSKHDRPGKIVLTTAAVPAPRNDASIATGSATSSGETE
jgi:NADPH:quinone reductase-like Zn-dependent oxidoreductase